MPITKLFHQNKCKYVCRPSTQSCVDIIVSSAQYYMRALDTFLQANRSFKRQLYGRFCRNHEWEQMLAGTVEDFVDSTCCKKEKVSTYAVVLDNVLRIHLFQMEMCEKKCEVCGVSKLDINKCNI